MYTAIIVLYALTACVAGYQAADYYKQMQGAHWVRVLMFCAFLFFGPTLVVFSVNNTVAIAYRVRLWFGPRPRQGSPICPPQPCLLTPAPCPRPQSTMALPFGTIVAIIAIWTLITLPLMVIGGTVQHPAWHSCPRPLTANALKLSRASAAGIVGKNSKTEFRAPCRTGKYPREIPTLPWYRSLPVQMVIAGVLPFSAIYIELYYIFASLWGHKVYTVWYILFVVFGILVIVTAFLTIALTYSQLSVEDHHWSVSTSPVSDSSRMCRVLSCRADRPPAGGGGRSSAADRRASTSTHIPSTSSSSGERLLPLGEESKQSLGTFRGASPPPGQPCAAPRPNRVLLLLLSAVCVCMRGMPVVVP